MHAQIGNLICTIKKEFESLVSQRFRCIFLLNTTSPEVGLWQSLLAESESNELIFVGRSFIAYVYIYIYIYLFIYSFIYLLIIDDIDIESASGQN